MLKKLKKLLCSHSFLNFGKEFYYGIPFCSKLDYPEQGFENGEYPIVAIECLDCGKILIRNKIERVHSIGMISVRYESSKACNKLSSKILKNLIPQS